MVPALIPVILGLVGTLGIEFYFWDQNEKTSQQILDAIGNVLYGMSFTDFLVACCLPLMVIGATLYVGYRIANPMPDGEDLDFFVERRAEETFIRMHGQQKGKGRA
jgi:hypothetical protein